MLLSRQLKLMRRRVQFPPHPEAGLLIAEDSRPNSPLIFRPEWRPTPRARNSTTQPPGVKRAFTWASLVKGELSHAGLHDQPLPTSPPSAASAASPVTPGGTVLPRPQVQDAVAELLKRNQKAFDDVINHPFPQALGEGTASLDGFRHYMITGCISKPAPN
ncbi:hypothetical protein B0H16DRAFT_52522 [Mycena metata]|uniref:Uncharacterized protein n=1 Tax=Mycena metata TaxID=1033252 RepID=A0AAD7N0X8_9AGAR|nr:hypothetical protein B0H16DRAFT_52522 [Mycena metata]